MNRVRWNALAVALCLVGGGVLGHVTKPTIHLADQQGKLDLEQVFPKKIGDWVLDTNMPVSIISPDVESLLKKIYAQTLSRTYFNPQGERMMLSVAYGGDQSDATRAHRPDVCYPAQGFELLSAGVGNVELSDGKLEVSQLLTKLGGRVEPVTFWITTGEYTSITGQQQKIAQMRYGLKGIIPDGMLVRVSSINTDEKKAYAQQAQFIAEMKQAMPAAVVPRVFGTNRKT